MSALKDVASDTGQSLVAVRAAVMDAAPADIAPEVVDRIRRSARQRGLTLSGGNSETRTILVVLPEHYAISGESNYFPMVLDGAFRAAFDRGHVVALKRLLPDTDLGRLANGESLRGIVWTMLGPAAYDSARFQEQGLPVVVLHGDPSAVPEGVACVECDNEQGIELAAQHLVDLGHRQIAFVTYGHLAYREFTVREQALASALRRHGLEPYPTIRYRADHDRPYWKHHLENGLTAVVVVSEALAGQVLREATEERLWLPDQLSVVGFDSTRYCESTVPKLTAVRQPLTDLAYEAVAMLIDRRMAFGRQGTLHRVFPCGLDVRESTAPPVGQ